MWSRKGLGGFVLPHPGSAKASPSLPMKGRETSELVIHGYASLWGVADLNGDVVARGAFIDSLAKTGAVNNGSSVSVWLGDNPEASAGSAWANPFDGRLDEVAIFNYAVSATEISTLSGYKKPQGLKIVRWVEVQ